MSSYLDVLQCSSSESRADDTLIDESVIDLHLPFCTQGRKSGACAAATWRAIYLRMVTDCDILRMSLRSSGLGE